MPTNKTHKKKLLANKSLDKPVLKKPEKSSLDKPAKSQSLDKPAKFRLQGKQTLYNFSETTWENGSGINRQIQIKNNSGSQVVTTLPDQRSVKKTLKKNELDKIKHLLGINLLQIH